MVVAHGLSPQEWYPEVRYANSLGSMLKKNIANASKGSAESFLYLNLAHRDYDLHQLAFCDQSQALLRKIPWLILLSDQYLVASLFLIPSFNQECGSVGAVEVERLKLGLETPLFKLLVIAGSSKPNSFFSEKIWSVIVVVSRKSERKWTNFLPGQSDPSFSVGSTRMDVEGGLRKYHFGEGKVSYSRGPNDLVFVSYQDSAFDLIAGLAKAKVSPANTQDVAALGFDSKNDSSQPSSMPDQKVLNEQLPSRFGNGSISKNKSSQPTSIPDDAVVNGLLAPGSGDGSSSKNKSSQPTSIPDDTVVNGLLAPGSGDESSSKNYSFQPSGKPDDKPLSTKPTDMPDDKLLGPLLAPGFVEVLGSKTDSSQPTKTANDKLLDGLLFPGFDDRSCLSRYRSFLYRKASQHKPSSYLLLKLRKYEDLHKRCGPYTRSYDKTLKRLKSNHTSSSSGCNYIVWLGSNGMGNRIISMASAFLYALLTNRVLLVDHGTDMTHLFCEPFPNTSWVLPMDFPMKKQFHALKLRHDRFRDISEKSPPSFVYFNIPHGTYDFDELFLCDNSRALLEKVPWFLLSSDQYLAPAFFLSPTFKQEVSKLFPEKETIFHHLGRYLFHPSNQAWGVITKFYQANLAKAEQRIGLQIRIFSRRTSPFEVVMDQILSCMLKNKLLPEVDTQNSVRSPPENRPSKAILITSLFSEYYENMSALYQSKPTVTGEVIRVYQPSHEEYQHKSDNMHNMKAWAEIYLLSLSDVLITSAGSTFGYVAQGLGGLKPWILIRPKNKMVPDPPCRRDKSMDPCFHYAPKYECKAKHKTDFGTLVPYIRHCADRQTGVKLFNDPKRS
ncbi:unnamed protein product [Dovyalis caffra]|uniref:Fucosyltransferase n=1 Tax=Dovyalis caffra TaxID=77055 RepID=A0AAV1RJ39_9ROSI|nr:unnamed protein product [Dovyalis caffra]